MIGFGAPLVLLALPLALVPLFTRWLRASAVTRLDLRPTDGGSALIDRGLTAAGMFAIAALIIGTAAPFLKGGTAPYRGNGANIVLLIELAFWPMGDYRIGTSSVMAMTITGVTGMQLLNCVITQMIRGMPT